VKSIILLFFVLTVNCTAQQVTFCERVDKFGNAWNSSDQFTIGPNGGFFKVLVKLNRQIDSKYVVYDLYNFKDGKETLDNSLRMEVNPTVSWFFKEITFHLDGEYHLYVYDDTDKLLGVGKVTIKLK
jgi:hypothetical protein